MGGSKHGGDEAATWFGGYGEQLFQNNPVVFAACSARVMLVSQAQFKFRKLDGAKELFGTEALKILENPWPNGTTSDLLSRMEQDVAIHGNAYVVRRRGAGGDRLVCLDPKHVTIVMRTRADVYQSSFDPNVDTEVSGYVYAPTDNEASFFDVKDVAHYAPTPDPTAQWRGMSWLSPAIREIQSDSAATAHKLKFFENAATPNMVVSFDASKTAEQIRKFQELFDAQHKSTDNAYKTLFLAGADATVVGNNFKDADFKAIQAMGETRIAACSGIAPVIIGFSEGLESATYANYSQARRRTADGTLRPLWGSATGALATIVDEPKRSQLAVDESQIAFLREDERDRAEINQANASTIRTMLDAGFDPDAAVEAVLSGDLARLIGKHSGLFSVQLQPPGSQQNNTEA